MKRCALMFNSSLVKAGTRSLTPHLLTHQNVRHLNWFGIPRPLVRISLPGFFPSRRNGPGPTAPPGILLRLRELRPDRKPVFFLRSRPVSGRERLTNATPEAGGQFEMTQFVSLLSKWRKLLYLIASGPTPFFSHSYFPVTYFSASRQFLHIRLFG